MNKIFLIITVCILLVGCRQAEQHGDAAPAAAAPAPMYDSVTPLGFKIQSNGYDFDPDYIDNSFLETESCLNYTDTPTDLYIVLKEPNKAFPCPQHPEKGCGGTYLSQVIKFSFAIRLKHEYIHYILEYHTSDPDTPHESLSFDQCS